MDDKQRYVYYSKKTGKWSVYINILGRRRHFGTYIDRNAAIDMVKLAIKERDRITSEHYLKEMKAITIEASNKESEKIAIKKVKKYLKTVSIYGGEKEKLELKKQIENLPNLELVTIMTERYVNKKGITRLMGQFQLSDRQLYRKVNAGCFAYYKMYGEVVDNAQC